MGISISICHVVMMPYFLNMYVLSVSSIVFCICICVVDSVCFFIPACW